MLASSATSSRRSPGVRRLPAEETPAVSGARRSRRSRRNRANSVLAIGPPPAVPPHFRRPVPIAGPGAWYRLSLAAPGPGGHGGAMDTSIALVTGANKGIGKEIARQLADSGATVFVGSRDAERGQRAVDEIGGDARLLVLDVTDSASITSAVRHVDTLDILVNNAGISGEGPTAEHEDPELFRRIYDTNVFG